MLYLVHVFITFDRCETPSKYIIFEKKTKRLAVIICKILRYICFFCDNYKNVCIGWLGQLKRLKRCQIMFLFLQIIFYISVGLCKWFSFQLIIGFSPNSYSHIRLIALWRDRRFPGDLWACLDFGKAVQCSDR